MRGARLTNTNVVSAPAIENYQACARDPFTPLLGKAVVQVPQWSVLDLSSTLYLPY